MLQNQIYGQQTLHTSLAFVRDASNLGKTVFKITNSVCSDLSELSVNPSLHLSTSE